MLDYLFGEKRTYVEDAHRIKWSCEKSLHSIFHRSKSPLHFGKKLRSWTRNNPCKKPLLVLMMAGTRNAFREGRYKSLN